MPITVNKTQVIVSSSRQRIRFSLHLNQWFSVGGTGTWQVLTMSLWLACSNCLTTRVAAHPAGLAISCSIIQSTAYMYTNLLYIVILYIRVKRCGAGASGNSSAVMPTTWLWTVA